MNITPNVNLERIEEADLKLQSQLNKCLNEKRRRQSEIGYLNELAGYISASASDMCSLSVKPDKCAILQETVNQIRRIKLAEECGSSDELQQSEVSSSKPNILGNDVLGPLLLQALDGFLFMVNTDGKIEFVSGNVKSFLKYSQDYLVDKSIYNIIHVGDHARFSSSLLPMTVGNGFVWNSEGNTSINKSRSFNCRFLVKPPEDQEETIEEKQTRVSQYENLQISAVLLPVSGEKSENSELDTEIQNHLICVARRMPSNEKSAMPGIEQFSTRLDLRGKILSIDTSGVSAIYSQYLNKDLVGRIIQELCHPEDFHKLTQHLKETLQVGNNTSGVYRLRLAHEKIVQVQTKSKHIGYNMMANEPEVIVATHSIIRDGDHCMENNAVVPQRSNSSPAGGSMVASLNNMNGNSYSFSSLSPDFIDIGLDMFPSSSWDLGGSDGQDLADGTTLQTSLGGPSTPASTSSITSGVQQRTQHASGSAFSPELLSGRGSPCIRSPAQMSTTGSPAPGRATPYNTISFSPVPTQAISRTSSPAPIMVKKEDMGMGDLSNLSPMGSGGMAGDSQNAANVTQKLRSLLTHGIEEADSSVSKNVAIVKMEEGDPRDMENNYVPPNSAENLNSRNVILRELLNTEEDDIGDDNAKSLQCDSNFSVPLSADMCSNEALQKRTINNNNMLRKLLNEDKTYRKNHELLIQQLLKTEGKVAVDANMAQKTVKAGSPSNNPSSAAEVMNSVAKRKSPDTPMEDSIAKRQAPQNPQHAHLAGQNPMLASMLAQTPRTAPTVPTSIANAIVSQLPQDRLPKNLEKKLIHTPYTGASTSGSNSATNSQYTFSQVQGGTRNLLSTSLQQEVVTADSRGHMTLAPQNNFVQGPGFLGKMLPSGDNSQSPGMGTYGNHFAHNSHQISLQSAANLLFGDGIVTEANCDPQTINTSDPLLSEILDQVWSMEQDMNLDSNPDDIALYKLLEEIPEQTPVTSPRPIPQHEVNEKMAINAIQRQLMSFEVASSPNVSRNSGRFPQPSAAVAASQPQMAPRSYSQVNQYQSAPPAYTMSTVNPNQRARAPIMHPVQGGNMQPSAQQMVQMNSQRQTLPQYNSGGLTSLNDISPQMRRTLLEQKQKYLLQQKRIVMQQKQQQLTLNTRQALPDNMQGLQSPSQGSFAAENMSDLMNSTVAPNVTLQRSASMPEPQLSPRYSSVQQMTNSGPPPSPSQLSPGQRQPAYSPHSQQGYPSGYPQARLSPHLQSQPAPTQSWVQRPTQNLTQQNPMLNAQLSQIFEIEIPTANNSDNYASSVQQASFGNHVPSRFTNQQQQQQQQPRGIVRSMPSPGSRNSPYSNPPDSPFHPPSPGVAMYQQQSPTLPQQQAPNPQQRLQRAVPIPNRVNSPQRLQAGFTGNDPILSSQPSPGNYNPPISNFNSMPVSTSSNYNSDNFSYDQQSGFPAAMMDRNRNSSGGGAMTEYVRQELRAMVGARTQQQVHQQQQLVQQMPPTPGSQSSNQSLSHADFEQLGFSLDLGNDGQPASPSLFPQSLLSVAGDNQSRTGSPRFQLEEQRPVEQKKSLLQQLLSEPT